MMMNGVRTESEKKKRMQIMSPSPSQPCPSETPESSVSRSPAAAAAFAVPIHGEVLALGRFCGKESHAMADDGSSPSSPAQVNGQQGDDSQCAEAMVQLPEISLGASLHVRRVYMASIYQSGMLCYASTKLPYIAPNLQSLSLSTPKSISKRDASALATQKLKGDRQKNGSNGAATATAKFWLPLEPAPRTPGLDPPFFPSSLPPLSSPTPAAAASSRCCTPVASDPEAADPPPAARASRRLIHQ